MNSITLVSICNKIAAERELEQEESDFLTYLDQDRLEHILDARYGYNGGFFTCELRDTLFPMYMKADILEPWNREYFVSTLAVEDGDDALVWIDDLDCCALESDEGNLWEWFDNTAYSTCWIEENTFWCSNCDERFRNDDYGGDGYCRNCYEEQYCGCEDEEEIEGLQGYCTNPIHSFSEPYFFGGKTHRKPEKARLLGVELETEFSEFDREIVMDLKEISNRMICKSDGSLCNGFELVTLPYDLMGHKTSFPWAAILRRMRDNCESKKSTGIHIHINRASLSELTITKLIAFLCDLRWKSFNETIAQRAYYSNGYCEVQTGNGTTKMVAIKKANDCHGRYVAVNTTNSNTIEIRIFAANLKYERVMKNLEFVDALCCFCDETSILELSPQHFMKWVADHRPSYRNLWGFLIEKGLVNPSDHKKECHGHGAQLRQAA